MAHTSYIVVFAIVAAVVLEIFGDPFVCDRTKRYQENECNNCSCSTDLSGNVIFACTRLACGPKSQELRKCDPKVTLLLRCCWCIPGWGTVCEIRD